MPFSYKYFHVSVFLLHFICLCAHSFFLKELKVYSFFISMRMLLGSFTTFSFLCISIFFYFHHFSQCPYRPWCFTESWIKWTKKKQQTRYISYSSHIYVRVVFVVKVSGVLSNRFIIILVFHISLSLALKKLFSRNTYNVRPSYLTVCFFFLSCSFSIFSIFNFYFFLSFLSLSLLLYLKFDLSLSLSLYLSLSLVSIFCSFLFSHFSHSFLLQTKHNAKVYQSFYCDPTWNFDKAGVLRALLSNYHFSQSHIIFVIK